MLHLSIRIFTFGLGALMFLLGLVAIGMGGSALANGVWILALGTATMIATMFQHSRYRSDAAERTNDEPGAGGGEVGYLEPRFQPTNEIFTDPTSHHLMRVYVDPRTGERRYRAEG